MEPKLKLTVENLTWELKHAKYRRTKILLELHIAQLLGQEPSVAKFTRTLKKIIKTAESSKEWYKICQTYWIDRTVRDL
jgi:hypothetical protein